MPSPASMATSFTGDIASAWPRPRGRSGCVTTASILRSGCAIKWRREGTANSGVPQKMIRSGTARLPVAGFFQFADLALDHVALEHTQMGDEEDAVQVVDLVAEGACEQSLAAHFEFLAGGVLRAHGHVLRTNHVSAKSRHGKAAFLFALLSLGVRDLRIGADDFCLGVFPVGHVDDRKA